MKDIIQEYQCMANVLRVHGLEDFSECIEHLNRKLEGIDKCSAFLRALYQVDKVLNSITEEDSVLKIKQEIKAALELNGVYSNHGILLMRGNQHD